MVSSGQEKRGRKARAGGGALILALEEGAKWRVWGNNTGDTANVL